MDYSLITNESLNYCVYAHINKNNGKMYVGITNNIRNRWSGYGQSYSGCTHFYNAIQKYGWDNFYHIIVVDNIPFSIACEIEKCLIHKYDTIHNGYNIKAGGEGGGALRDKHHKSRPIYQYDFDGNFIKKWDCPIDAEKYYHIDDVTRSTNGTLLSAAGFQWSYEYVEKLSAYSHNRNHRFLPIYQYDIDGNFIKKWNHYQDAIDRYGQSIKSCAYGIYHTSAGYRWSFEYHDQLSKIKRKVPVKKHNKYEDTQKVCRYDLCGNLICKYDNCASIPEDGIDSKTIFNLCNKKYNYVYMNSVWVFEDDIDSNYIQDVINDYNKKHPKIVQYDLNGNCIHIFNTFAEAEKSGYKHSSLSKVCNKRKGTAYGFQWRYYGDPKPDAIKKNKNNKPIPVIQKTLNGDYVAKFDSAYSAAQKLSNSTNKSGSCILKVCRGEKRSAYGYRWEFEHENGGDNNVQLD